MVLRCLLVVCVSVCLVLAVGVSYGRYEQKFDPVDYPFAADNTQRLILGGVVTQSWLDAGTWPQSPSWQVSGTSAQLSFSVSNGRGQEEFVPQTQTYVLQMLLGLDIADPRQVTLQLVWEEGGETHRLTAAAQEIPEGSLLQGRYGSGWIYRFYEEGGAERQFLLPGDGLHYQNFTLEVTGSVDPTLLVLQAVEPYSN
ncbi:MAG: hypothetical protein E7457_02840 [Ruminococcaceae bacterium]|nr:hypothetical protein [Oscillospiraceae bacterium]